jgi:AP2-associated kinase
VKAAAAALDDSDSEPEDKNITSNVDFLRVMESDDSSKKKDHRRSSSQSKHGKRSSLPSISLSNTKNILAGKFGDAFRRFESNVAPQEPLTPTDQLIDRPGNSLTPIAGSEATGERSDDENAIDETQDLPPEVRRELERRRLSQEEKRVADAAAEYRKQLADQGEGGKGGKGGPTRASTIQNRVKTLLDDSKVVPAKTAEGYGRFTESSKALPARPFDEPKPNAPIISRKPVAKPAGAPPADLAYGISRQLQPQNPGPLSASSAPMSTSVPAAALRTGSRPSAPPKPKALRTGGQFEAPIMSPAKPAVPAGKPLPTPVDAAIPNGDDWEASFSKRYPSLSGLELVETEIGIGRGSGARIRDV